MTGPFLLSTSRWSQAPQPAQYTMGDGLEAMRRSGTSSFYHYNHLGTTLALTGTNEAVTDTYQHDAWGVLLGSTGSTVNPHTYVGQQRYYRMPTADLYHLGFRDYAQRLGRFTTVDPARDGENWFAYVVNRPGMGNDPMGLQANEENVEIPIPEEWAWLPPSLQKCYIVGQQSRFPAVSETNKRFGEDVLGTLGDAFRHCLWMCLITARCGSMCAAIVGLGHEYENYRKKGKWEDIVMDLYNNPIGIGVGRQLDRCEKEQPLEPCIEGCLEAKDKFLWLKPSRHIPGIFRFTPPEHYTPGPFLLPPRRGGFDLMYPWRPPLEQ